jgi:hypothetical protein
MSGDRKKFQDNVEKALELERKNREKNERKAREARLKKQRKEAAAMRKENERIRRQKGKHEK